MSMNLCIFQLFDHIAACLANFMEENGLKGTQKLPLGFTFSFPCAQEGLAVARLINWSKGFSASGVVGRDIVELLREACDRRHVGFSFRCLNRLKESLLLS